MIGVVADDLTGAAELGAIGLRHGLQAEVVLAGALGAGQDLVCIDTDSRACSPAEAGRRAGEAALRLRRDGVEWVYKKTDSVLRGNVVPEIEAIVRQLGLSGALLVPANPSLGRTIVDGRYYVRGQLIHETDFARDPKHPRTSPCVTGLVDPPAELSLSVAKPGLSLPRSGIVIGEAASPADLRHWAAVLPRNWLPAGGAEFFAALQTRPVGATQPPLQPARQLFVCGSVSQATLTFVAGQLQQGVPVVSLGELGIPGKELPGADVAALADRLVCGLGSHKRAILHVGLPRIRDSAIAESLPVLLARVAEAVLKKLPVPQVFAEGGATAVSVARQLGWHRLAVKHELAPGVVALSAEGRSARMLVMKPGSYTWPASVQSEG